MLRAALLKRPHLLKRLERNRALLERVIQPVLPLRCFNVRQHLRSQQPHSVMRSICCNAAPVPGGVNCRARSSSARLLDVQQVGVNLLQLALAQPLLLQRQQGALALPRRYQLLGNGDLPRYQPLNLGAALSPSAPEHGPKQDAWPEVAGVRVCAAR